MSDQELVEKLIKSLAQFTKAIETLTEAVFRDMKPVSDEDLLTTEPSDVMVLLAGVLKSCGIG